MSARICMLLLGPFFFLNGHCWGIELSEEVQAKIGGFLRIVLGQTMTAEVESELGESAYSCELAEMLDDTPIVELKAVTWHATANGATGVVYSYGRNQMFEEEKDVALALKLEDAVSKDVVNGIYHKLLEFYSLAVDEGDYETKFVDPQDYAAEKVQKQDRNLFRCVWNIQHEINYESYPCRGRHLNISVSASTGLVGAVSYRPVVIPEEDEWKVTASEAASALQAWLDSSPYFSKSVRPSRIGELSPSDLQRVIACPRMYPEKRISRGEKLIGPVAFYCWEVPFEYQESGHRFSAVGWIRSENGEIIGWR